VKEPRVCIITTFFYPAPGGVEKQLERFTAWMVSQGVPVMVVTRLFDKKLPKYELVNGVEVYRVPVSDNKALSMLQFLGNGLRLLIQHRNKYNIINSHQIYSPTTLGWIASRLFGYPLVVSTHLAGSEGDVGRTLRRGWLGRMRLNILRDTAAAFIPISQAVGQELIDYGVDPKKVHALGNGIDTSIYKPIDDAAKRQLRQKLGLPVDVPLVFFGGRLVEIKGVDVLLEAFQQVPAPAHLVIAGTGPLEEQFKAHAGQHLPGRVTFVGQQQNMHEYLQASDAWTLPSRGEGLPLALVEALAVALPVIVTPVGGMPELVQDGVTGMHVPVNDIRALAEALNKAVSGSAEVKAMGERGRKLIIERLSLDEVSASYVRLFRQLINTSATRNQPQTQEI
jgi:glycosyltransferase involved in cell wall biosynthesis